MATDQIYKVSEKLPSIQSNTDRQFLNTLVSEYATRDKFAVSVSRSDSKRLICQCVRSGKHRNMKRVEGPSKRRTRMSHKIECPYTIRFYKPKGKNLFNLIGSKDEKNFAIIILLMISICY